MCQLADMSLPQPLVLAENEERVVQVVFTPEPDAQIPTQSFCLMSLPVHERSAEVSQTHLLGQVIFSEVAAPLDLLSYSEIQARCSQMISKDDYYRYEAERQLDTGEYFQWLSTIWRGEGEALGRLVRPNLINGEQDAAFYPTLIDACLQVATSLLFGQSAETWLPFSFSSVQFFAVPSSDTGWCHAQQVDIHCWNIQLFDDTGKLLCKINQYAEKPASVDHFTKQPWNQWLYGVDWQSMSLSNSDPVRPSTHQNEQKAWLIFADNKGISEALASVLQKNAQSVVLVFPGDEFSAEEENLYTLNPNSPNDYQRLFAQSIGQVVYLWSIDQTDDLLGEVVQAVCQSALYLAQAALNAATLPDAVWMVTQDSQAVIPDDRLDGLAQAPLWGMGKVLTAEHPELACRLVDLEATATGADLAQVLLSTKWMPHSAASPQAIDNQLALRQGKCYAARLVHQQLAAQVPDVPHGEHEVMIHAEASYLITGGLGGLGLSLAEWLVKQGAKQLILLGRQQPTSDVIEQLAVLEQQGAQITLMQADVTDWEQMEAVFATLDKHYPLRGVVHAAGVVDDHSVLNVTAQQVADVLAPKVLGSWHLHRLTEQIPLDFYVLFSSSASLLGSQGQTNYAAANTFLDGLAHYRQSRGLPALSINWGTWDEVGMAARLGLLDHAKQQGEQPIPVQTGLTLLGQLLDAPLAQIGVIPMEWSRFLSQQGMTAFYTYFAHFVRQPALTDPSVVGQPTTIVDELTQMPAEQRAEALEASVNVQIAEVLGLDVEQLAVERNTGFMALGLDSLTSVELRNRLQRRFSCTLPLTFAFDYSTVAKIVDYFNEHILVSMNTLSSDKATESDAQEADSATSSEQEQPSLSSLFDKLSDQVKY